MKFAQEFKKCLQKEGFPQRWVESAIPYGQLKKCLKKVTGELRELGLDRETLARLTPDETALQGELGFQYQLDGGATESRHLRPRLTVFIHLKDGIAVDASLTPSTRVFLEKIASRTPQAQDALSQADTEVLPSPTSSRTSSSFRSIYDMVSAVQQVEVPLVFDAEFFDILQSDVSSLDKLQLEEQRNLHKEIVALGRDLTKVTKPSRSRKSQKVVEAWRDIFQLYLDARVFFSAREKDHGARSSTQALQQLQWFQGQVLERKLLQNLKHEASQHAYSQFLHLNAVLLQHLKFQEINRLAVAKILKKFDKRTSLGAAQTFRTTIYADKYFAGDMAKDMCAQISSEIVTVVPQLDDYLCPICLTVAYWPLRLDCQHVFCTRCMVKMSRKVEKHCPLCRASVVMKAGLEHIDSEHAAFLRRYFPKEVKEKLQASERERNKEIFGPQYEGTQPCTVM